jgi:hypothetical protein
LHPWLLPARAALLELLLSAFTELDIGVCCEYEAKAFRRAVVEVTADPRLGQIRRRANSLGLAFSSEGMASWLWRSLDLGKPADLRYENLVNLNLDRHVQRW